MGKSEEIKIVRKVLVGLTVAEEKELGRKVDSGLSQTDAIRRAIMGRDKFNVFIEDWLSDFQSKRGISREQAIELLLDEAIHLRKAGQSPSARESRPLKGTATQGIKGQKSS